MQVPWFDVGYKQKRCGVQVKAMWSTSKSDVEYKSRQAGGGPQFLIIFDFSAVLRRHPSCLYIYTWMQKSSPHLQPDEPLVCRRHARFSPDTLQLSVRVPRELHQQFYAACQGQGTLGSEVLRVMMQNFVTMAREQSHG